MSDQLQDSPSDFPFEVGEIQHGELPLDLLPNTMREIANFTVGIVIGDDLLGSGTLIDMGRRRGILTAHHVASRVMKADDDALGLVVADHPHRLCVRPSLLAHTIIGAPPSSEDWRPDLSFLGIGDHKLLGTLASKKSFVYMDKRSDQSFAAYPRREELWWFVAGFPAEFSSRINAERRKETLTKSSNFVGQATLLQHFEQGDYDYLRLRLYDPAHGFPLNYGGVSGGGIWMVPLEMNPDKGPHTAKAAELFLAGVCCYQHEPLPDGREVEGHGPRSLYRCMREIRMQGGAQG
jgi:hypothetical protein